jgi:hypothetical protein
VVQGPVFMGIMEVYWFFEKAPGRHKKEDLASLGKIL